jgi:hypothetical protein
LSRAATGPSERMKADNVPESGSHAEESALMRALKAARQRSRTGWNLKAA